MIEDKKVFYLILPVSLVLIVHALSTASELFLWFICAYFLFVLIDPYLSKMRKLGMNQAVAALILILVSSALIFLMGLLFFRAGTNIFTQIISYKQSIRELYSHSNERIHEWLSIFSPVNSQVKDAASEATQATPANPGSPISPAVGAGILTGVSAFLSVLSYVALTPILTFFMVTERELFGKIFVRLNHHEGKLKSITQKIHSSVHAYFIGNLILIIISLPIFCLAFWLLGVKSFLSLSLLSAIFNLVPFLGFFLAATLPAIDLILNGGSILYALILIAVCFFTHFTIANVVTPKLLGSRVDLNATSSTIALIAWGTLWGPLGLLLAIPLTAILKIFLLESDLKVFKFTGSLMSQNSD